jgi:O-antigen ligase
MLHTTRTQLSIFPKIISLIYLFILMGITSVFGGHFAWAENIIVCMLGMLAMILLCTPIGQGLPWGKRSWPLWVIVVCTMCVLILPLISSIPTNAQSWGAALGLATHPFFSTLSLIGIEASWSAQGLNPAANMAQWPLPWAYAAAAIIVACLAHQEEYAHNLLKGFVVLVLAFAVYGILEYAAGWEMVMWEKKYAYLNSLTATFINRNHSATLLGLGVLASLALGFYRVGEVSTRMPFTQRAKIVYHLCLRPGWYWFLIAAVLAIALVLTNSRAGLGVTGLGVLTMLVALAWARPAVRVFMGGGLIAACVMLVVVLAAVGGTIGQRLENTSEDAAVRGNINNLSWKSWENAPIWGQGFGSWQGSAASVRTDELSIWLGTLDSAHNTYLELLVELGVVGVTVLAIMLWFVLGLLINGLVVRRRQVIWPAFGLGTLALIMAHAAYDFSLSIPALALAVITLLTLSTINSLAPLPPESKPQLAPIPLRVILALTLVPAVALAGWQTWSGYPSRQAQPVMSYLRAGLAPSGESIAQARIHLTTCLQRNPFHPTCADDLSLLYLARASQIGLDNNVGKLLLRVAEKYAKQSLAQNPANAIVAYRLSRIRALLRGEAAGNTALMHSVLAGPAEPRLAMARAVPLLTNYHTFSADDQILAAGNIRLLWQLEPRYLWRTIKPQAATTLPVLAEILAQGPGGITPELMAQWQKVTKQPWPSATPLGSKGLTD